jgi:fatty-acyl-CoA synthase
MGFFDRLRGDVTYLRGALRTLRLTKPIARNPARIFPVVVEEVAARYGDKPALVSDRESLTYRELVEHSCRYSRWALAQGLAKGEVVALLMTNRPEYVAIWLGIVRAGGTVALLNTNLSGAALAHCIDIVTPRHVIAAGDLVDTLKSSDSYRKTAPLIWIHGDAKSDSRERLDDHPRIDQAAASLDASPLSAAERPALTIEDKALFVYTSGTSGMPKAANVNHFRLMLASHAFAGVMGTRPDDRMYDCLPMYHTSGGVCATGALLAVGGTVFIREKFSAHEFWDDVVDRQCTLFMYIGELCRYLVNTPPHPKERVHRLTIDGELQKSLETLALDRAQSLGPDMSVAIMVINNGSGEVLARVASPDYFDVLHAAAESPDTWFATGKILASTGKGGQVMSAQFNRDGTSLTG